MNLKSINNKKSGLFKDFGFVFFMLLFGLLDFPGFSSSGFSDFASEYRLLSPASYALPLILWGFFGAKIKQIRLKVMVSCICFLAALSLLFIAQESFPIPFAMVAYIMLLGFGIAGGMDAWMTAIDEASPKEDASHIIACCFAATILEIPCTLLLQGAASPILLLIIVVGSLLPLARSQSTISSKQANAKESEHRPARRHRQPTWKGLLFFAPIALSAALLQTLAFATPLIESGIRVPSLFGRLLGYSCVLALWKLRKEAIERGTSLYLANMLVVILAFCLAAIGFQEGEAYMAASGFSFSLGFASCLLLLLDGKYALKHSLPQTACIGMGLIYAIIGAGVLLGNAITNAFDTEMATFFVIALIILGVMAVASLALNMFQNGKQEPLSESTGKTSLADKESKVNLSGVAKKYALSKRELEILSYLAQGRSVPYMATKLYLSENTIRGYTKKLYKKMNVHGKQELLDLVELQANE